MQSCQGHTLSWSDSHVEWNPQYTHTCTGMCIATHTVELPKATYPLGPGEDLQAFFKVLILLLVTVGSDSFLMSTPKVAQDLRPRRCHSAKGSVHPSSLQDTQPAWSFLSAWLQPPLVSPEFPGASGLLVILFSLFRVTIASQLLPFPWHLRKK